MENLYINAKYKCEYIVRYICCFDTEIKIKKQVVIYNDNMCSICLENNTDVYLTPCGHTFHKHCILMWTDFNYRHNRRKTCPMCKVEKYTVVTK